MRRFAALLLTGFSVTAAYAQAPNTQVREPRNEAQGNRTGEQHMTQPGIDREAAIGHALGMAIEGSALWHCAQEAEAKVGKADQRDAKADRGRNQLNQQALRDPGAVLEQHARDAFRSSDTLFMAVKQDERAGEQAANRGANAAANANDPHLKGANSMNKHQACEDFYRAARDYSRALQASCSSQKQASSSGNSESCVENAAKVALINHAVKEAVDGVALMMMLRHHGRHDRTTQALESHAQQMLASGRQAIESIGNSEGSAGRDKDQAVRGTNLQASNNQNQAGKNEARANGSQNQANSQTTRREAARPVYNDKNEQSGAKEGEPVTVNHLAKLGREVIRAVEELNQNPGRPQVRQGQ